MKIAVMSDIHGNYVALERCIEYALSEGVQAFVFLGDYVGELAYPQKTMDILKELKNHHSCYFVKGNKEDYWLNYERDGECGWSENDSTTGSLYYTYHNLSSDDLVFFKSLSHSAEISFEGLPIITICHGSPMQANEKLLPDKQKTFEIMERDNNTIILCGHTHLQGLIEHDGKMVLNPGAVGVSLHSDGKSQFMILTGTEGTWEHEFISLDYDVEQVIADLKTSGLSVKAPSWCKVSEHLLRTGEISHGTVLAKAMALCKEELGECIWPMIPEKYWEMAVEELLN